MMWQRRLLLLVTTLTAFIYNSHGCQMEGVTSWFVPVLTEVIDIQRGTFFSRATTNILSIESSTYGEGLRAGPYIVVDHSDSVFTISTNNAFPDYESNEIADSMSITVQFACSAGPSVAFLVFQINVIDTNNNAPEFRPTDVFEFTLTPPLPPGFQITGCLEDITVRDIDLTTQRIEFAIEDNPYFEIDYDSALTVPNSKEFKAVLRTTTLIRTIPEVIELRITATDVDQTGDPPLTAYATLRIQGDSEFELPAEPIFSQVFYLAEYTPSHEVILQEPILLRQGYDASVTFSLEGEHLENFALIVTGNQLSVDVNLPLSDETLRSGQIFLIVRAEREFTSGASTTVVVQLPEILGLEFEEPNYEGSIEDNILQPLQLTLSQGYEDGVSVTVISDYASFFTATAQENVITLTMTALDENIINENNFIILQVIASTDHSTATTVVTLEIVKDDNSTPVFGSAVYTGNYEMQTGLDIDQITVVQGYDVTVEFALVGEHASFFQLDRAGPVLTLTSSTLPPEILSEQHLLLTIRATKPRTVGANAALSITLPPARALGFQESTYSGTIQDATLILQTIVLNVGYDEDVVFALTGDFAESFSITNVQNQVTINLLTPLPASVISENNFIMLTLSATGEHASPTSTNVLLEILKQDVTTPVFSQSIYSGAYSGTSNIDIESISLLQGFDSSVSFRLEGEHAQYFGINNVGNNVVISLETAIPEELIFSEKVLLFSILADKPLTVGANAAVAITFPPELTDPIAMRFSQNTYVGSLEDDLLTLDNIMLETGFAPGTEFQLTGEFASYFTFVSSENVVTVSLVNTLPEEVKDENELIVLELEAERDRAVSVSTSIVIDIVKQEIEQPIFGEAYYRGVYTSETGLQFEEEISLSQGYDTTVTFELQGEHATLFTITPTGNSVVLAVVNAIPEDVLLNNNQLLLTIAAHKPDTIGARGAISIDLPKEIPEAIVLRFTQSSYVGSINNQELQAPIITLDDSHTELIHFDLTGEYSSYFALSRDQNDIGIDLIGELPPEVTEENTFIILDLTASYPSAISGYTSLVIEIIKQPLIVTPVFEQAYYTGEYSEQDGLLFEHTIQLIEGFDETVSFILEGDDSQWFELIQTGMNSLSLRLREDDMLGNADRSHLVFSVVASKPNTLGGRAAIVIALSDFSTTIPLRFSQNYYVGTIESGHFTIDAIHLEEGYTADMAISFTGDYVDYFQLTNEEGSFTLQLTTELPAGMIEDNNVLIFTLEVQVESISTHATIIVELIKEEIRVIAFDEPFYLGSYSATDGLIFNHQITLDGYDESVEFSLEGENVEWFQIEQSGNTVTIVLPNSLPPEVVNNNQHLTFIVTARNLNGMTARAAIIVTLTDDITFQVLRFERNSYIGSIENDEATIETITLNEGYTSDVSFNLIGELSTHFRLVLEEGEPTVNIILDTSIPEESIPINRIILLEVQASAFQATPAYATVVFQIVSEDVTYVELIFSEPHYSGHYTEALGLIFNENIMLTEGYDETVEFALEGDQSQWFAATSSANSVSLVVIAPIPSAVLINNHQLIFVITAQRPDSNTARATIVISLTDEFTDDLALGFERISYLGSIENNVSTLEPITLSEGYTPDVSFILHGALSEHFSLTSDGATVTIALENTIPEQVIPSRGVIVLELQASAPETQPAFATIVLEIVPIVELVFNEPHYSGHYTEAQGLIFNENIMLTEGYDETVEFALEGDHSQWFAATSSANSVSLVVIAPIPSAILINNHQLIFVISAQRPDSNTARATIVISLTDEFTNDLALGFERISYLGSIENNVSTLEPITLSEGYTPDVSFILHGALSEHFSLTSDGATVTIVLENTIPEQAIPSSGVIVLELQASAPETQPAFATIVFEIVPDNTPLVELVFSEPHYSGHYTEALGLIFNENIMLTEGYDETVEFALEGEHSQWFAATSSANSVSLVVIAPIPSAVLINNHQLIFVITAQRPDSNTARATIVISLTDEFTDDLALGFERISYLGSIENNVSTLEPITLSEGYTPDVSFILHGALSEHFSLTSDGATVTIALENTIPEQVIPSRGVIVLELQASAPETQPAFATIVLEIVPIVELVFNEPHYSGHYTEAQGLIFNENIMLTEGYDETVEFALEGDHSQWFAATSSANSVSLVVIAPIPSAILINNHQLIFVISAQRPDSNTARATIVISLTDEFTDDLALGFERISYLGWIENNVSTLEPITLSEGYTPDVSFILHGALSEHFSLTSDGATVTIVLENTISEQAIPSSGVIVLELQASAPETQPAFATIVFEIVPDNTPLVELVFSEPHYSGHYTEALGLIFNENIMLTEGYDETVEFALEGEHSQWFAATSSANSVSLVVIAPIPSAVLINNHQLIFVITAQRPDTNTTRATIVISLTDEFTDDLALGFERISYLGSIENNVSTLEPITLSEGYTPVVSFILHGALSEHFILTSDGATVTIALENTIPDQVIASSGVIVLELQASAPETQPAFATIVFEIVPGATPIVELVFNEPHYSGHYTEAQGLIFNENIMLTEGYDETVEFALEGDHSQWFAATSSANSVSLVVIAPIPSAILINNHQLIFVISAQRPDSNTARATIVISLTDEFTDDLALGFERISYLGWIENNVSTLEPITLSEGYTPDVSFILHGALSEHFILTSDGATVTIALENTIPDQVIASSGVIVLELQASAPETQPAFATIVFEIVPGATPIVELVFNEPHYSGHYTEAQGLIFNENIMLTEGYDETVEFALEGDHSQWFAATSSANSVSLVVIAPIPSAILINNHQLIFVISAQRPDSNTARATIVISLTDEFTDDLALGFERISYLGWIENNVSTLEPITLSEGYTPDVSFILHGALSEHFSLTSDGATVTIVLENTIPEQVIPSSGVIVLELQASATETQPAFATIVFEIVLDNTPLVELVFSEPHYSGHYTEALGLIFNENIMLTEGYDETVEFALEGEHSQWFAATSSANSVSLVVIAPIPSAVLINNHQLIFVITAQRPDSNTARATIVISLTDEFTDDLALSFERISYLGSIENNVSTLEPITLSEGYTPNVSFILHGALSEHFSLTSDGATVTIALENTIPEQVIASSGVIVLELQASAPETQPAFATIVFEIVTDDTPIVELVFNEPHYSGHYTEAQGLIFNENIMLTEGYDETVEFALEGEHSQWFAATSSANSVSLVVIAPIPSAVLINNHQLIFVITAQRPDSNTARATIVISLTDEFTDDLALGFERISYLGSIENNVSTLEPITLSEGYTPDVSFILHGALSEHFSLTSDGATVTIALENTIPEQEIASSGVIVLELQASAPETQPAFATIVFEIVTDDTPIVELVFNEPHYSGHYTEAQGLIFNENIILTEGYDETVEFALEGDHSQWFAATSSANLVSLVVIAPIPSAVLINNHQLIFVITAQRPDTNTARATIVISLTDEFTDDLALGFERISYLGSIENNVSTLEPITLSEGYTPDVSFILHGALSEHFSLTSDGATVTIALENTIPDQVIASSRVIVLELQASAPETQPAFATIVFEIVTDDKPIVELVFSEPHYSGHYTEAQGLIFNENIMLTEGYDETVEFALEGDHSQWFAATSSVNSVSLVVIAPIPSAVLINNHQLIFVITAQRPDSNTARATIVISLTDEFTDDLALGFERISYLGSIENNVSTLEPITLSEGYTPDVSFILHGALSEHFSLTSDGATVTIVLENTIPEQVIPSSGVIVLELQASAPETQPAFATIVFEIVPDNTPIVELVFNEPHYSGHYTEALGLIFNENIMLTEGYDETVEFALEGEHSQWFAATSSANSVSLVVIAPIPSAVLINNHQLIFVITAQRPDSNTARATIVISLTDEFTDDLALGFERISYLGSIENNVSILEPITLSEGYTPDVSFILHGALSVHFSLTSDGATVTIALDNTIPEQVIASSGVILLELQASAPETQPAFATIVFEIVTDDTPIVELVFSEPHYSGHYTEAQGLIFNENIILTEGYDETVEFALEGEHSQWFAATSSANSVSLVVIAPIPSAVLINNHQLIFVIAARRPDSNTARATIVISLTDDSQTGPEVSFEKVLFEGIIQAGVVAHELITVSGYFGTDIEIFGEYAELFIAYAVAGEVDVRGRGTVVLADDVSFVALELRAAGASTVLLLDVISSPEVELPLPSVEFNSPTYSLRAEISQTGLLGRVQATADNGEAVVYSLDLEDDHLLQRLSIDNDGGIHLSAPANSGIYNFQVFATTVFTRVSGAAQIHLTVDAITVCGEDDELFMPPLLILERDEEAAHSQLIPLTEEYEGCQYRLTNRWPADQTWLYTDQNGLHAHVIDREDESIAFMALSQIQVELLLECDRDNSRTRSKRSLITGARHDWLGPYDYGNNKWILSDTILYNSRRTLVNLIVNDINDHSPIFDGSQNQPIIVGYPIPELEERVLPRALIELKATDKDVGENAALMYWSSDEALAVSPTTGFVHVRHTTPLENDASLTVFATDRNGIDGNTGSLQLLVKLLDINHIAVVTVRNAFLENEQAILNELTAAVGYEVKVLRSTVISDDSGLDELDLRKNREVNYDGASMQLYVYGIIDREPVDVDRLTADINSNAGTTVSIASTISLEDHLDSLEICSGRDTGLLAATIVLSVLLFILIVVAAVWFFLRWRKNRNYEQFEDANSLASQNESLSLGPPPKLEPSVHPRLNIEELRRSEKKLQERLHAPIEEVTVEPSTSSREPPVESVVNMSILDPQIPQLPIVIQSIDKLKDGGESEDDDEFGERKKPRKKSVVTFNENVEKIIHVEDVPDEGSLPDMEVYKL